MSTMQYMQQSAHQRVKLSPAGETRSYAQTFGGEGQHLEVLISASLDSELSYKRSVMSTGTRAGLPEGRPLQKGLTTFVDSLEPALAAATSHRQEVSLI